MKLTIVGLDVLGTSLGLALKAADAEIQIVGHDPMAERVARARKMGAIDQSHWNLIAACEKADLVVLNVSLEEMEHTLTALRQDLREQAVVVDLAPLKKPVLEWAHRLLPRTVQFVGGHIVVAHPILSDTQPSAALLREATFYIIVPDETEALAFNTVSDVAQAVGATPQIIDPVEHDGLVAATTQLPIVAAAALLELVAGSAGWKDRAKACGSEVNGLGAMLTQTSATAQMLLANPEALVLWLDNYMAELDMLRQLITTGDRAALEQWLTRAQEHSQACLAHGEPSVAAEAAENLRGGWLRDMFLGRWVGRGGERAFRPRAPEGKENTK